MGSGVTLYAGLWGGAVPQNTSADPQGLSKLLREGVAVVATENCVHDDDASIGRFGEGRVPTVRQHDLELIASKRDLKALADGDAVIDGEESCRHEGIAPIEVCGTLCTGPLRASLS